MHNYYDILGIKYDASAEEAREAYIDLVKVWHPDRFVNDNQRLQKRATDKLKEINDAYEKLKAANFQNYGNKENEPSNNDKGPEEESLAQCPLKSCSGFLDSKNYCSTCGRHWRKKRQEDATNDDNFEKEPESIRKPQKGELVCGNCGYIVGVGKPPKHTFWGGLVCPDCNHKGFFKV